jgi:glycosyltransferase involved in cell wall biosynthesis
MDAGLPVASTDVGDVRHMVSRENQRYIVNGSDHELGAALRALVTDAAARKGIGAANRRRLRQDYQAKDMIAAYEALFRRSAGAGSRGLKTSA